MRIVGQSKLSEIKNAKDSENVLRKSWDIQNVGRSRNFDLAKCNPKVHSARSGIRDKLRKKGQNKKSKQ